jgi:hypothetical protein
VTSGADRVPVVLAEANPKPRARTTTPMIPRSTRRAAMAFARVVSFDGVSKDRMKELEKEINQGERPEGLPATEIIALHDAEAEKSLVIVFFETEDDYRRGDETLSAMPAGDTPGQRTSVTKYDVAIRMIL